MTYRGGRFHVRENSKRARESADIKVLRTLITREPARAIDIKVLADLRKRDSMFFYRY